MNDDGGGESRSTAWSADDSTLSTPPALALIELSSIARGYQVADAMVKKAAGTV